MTIRGLLKTLIPLRALGRPLAYLAGQVARLSGRRAGLAIAYHRVGDPQGNPTRELVPALGTRLFEAQLRHLAARYDVVPASELLAAARARKRGRRFPVAITFDDDLASHSRVAMPILRRLGIPATFFACGASLDHPFAFWWERLQTAADRGVALAPLVHGDGRREAAFVEQNESIHEVAATIQAMPPSERDAAAERLRSLLGPDPGDAGLRAADLRALSEAGFDVGFHTLRHYWLIALSDDALGRAMTEGRQELAQALGRELTMIAYPHGGGDPRVAAAARAAGFRLGFRTSDEAVAPDADPLLIGRLEPPFDSLGHFALKVVSALTRRQRSSA